MYTFPSSKFEKIGLRILYHRLLYASLIDWVRTDTRNKQKKFFFKAKSGIPGQFGVKTGTALKPSTYHTLGHLSLASLLDLSTLSSFQLILAHFEPVRGHTCTVSNTPDTKTLPHYSYHTTYIRPATISNGIQNIWYARIQHNGHRLQFVCHIEVDSVLIEVRVLVCAARNFVPPCASDSRGWHTYLVQQYRSTRRKSKYDHESKKCMPCGAIYTIDAYQCFVYIAYKKTVSQSVENLVCPLYRCT